MIILGIDTAIRCTGYGIINMCSINNIKIIDCGVIKNSPKMPHSECLRRIAGGISQLAELYSIDVASIEEAFLGRNIKTAMILSLARGAAITAATLADIPIYGYSPRSAKKAVVGSGKASKEQVASMMSGILHIDIGDIPLDSTDALALAVCHGQLAIRPELKDLLTKPI